MAIGQHFDLSISIFSQSIKTVASRPFRHLGLLLGIPAAILVFPLWGLLFSSAGWITARRRLENDGISALGSILAPRKARQQYDEGVFRGLWRVHGFTLSVVLLQVPIMILLYFPVVLVWMLVSPIYPGAEILPFVFGLENIFAGTTSLLPGSIGETIAFGAIILALLSCIIIFTGQFISLFRLVAIMPPPYSLGMIYRMVAASWSVTIKNYAKLVVLSVLLVFLAGAFFLISLASYFLARALDVGAAGEQVVMIWTAVILALFFISIFLEAVVLWSYKTGQPKLEVGETFCLSSWLLLNLKRAYDWILHYGLHALATAICIVAGLVATFLVLYKDLYSFSSVGLGWFAVTSSMLVILAFKKGVKP